EIQPDGARPVVEREVVEQVSDIDVHLVADRNDPGKADRSLGTPFHHGSGERTRLRDQSELTVTGPMRGKTGIEARARKHDADAIGTDDANLVFARGLFDRF